MASLIDEIIDVLTEEEKVYNALLECAEKKTQIIIDADIAALEQLTIQEQAKSDELISLRNKQIQLLKDINTVLGQKEKNMTSTNLIPYISSQPHLQEKLSIAKDNLIVAANKVQERNQQNEILLKQAMELTEFDILLLKSMRQAPETANYDKNACNTGARLSGGDFDTKQ